MVAKKGEKLSQYTKDLMSKNRTKDKKKCQFCENQFVDLEKHHQKCPKNPKNRERLRVERNQKRKKNKDRINFLQNIATAKRMQIPEKREQRQKQQYNNRQKPKVKKRNNENRNISRPKRDKKIREELFKILGGEDWSKCKKCGFKDHRAIIIEHIHDDGYLDNQRFTDDRARNYYYTKHPEEAKKKLQIFCWNCNTIKLHNQRETKWKLKHHSPNSEKNKKLYSELKQKAHQILGGNICTNSKCNFNDPRAMEIEHIDGGGKKDRGQFNRSNEFYQDIVDNPQKAREKLQMMCSNCNHIKQYILDNGDCNCKKFHVNYF